MLSKGKDSTVLQDEKIKCELRDNSSSQDFKPSAPLCILMIGLGLVILKCALSYTIEFYTTAMAATGSL